MGRYEDFIDGLQKDVDVPADVSQEFSKTLYNLPDYPTVQNKARTWITALASTAAVLAISTGVLMANPVLAAKIPIIGKIFERVEDRVTYSGDFKGKAEVLTVEPEGATAEVTLSPEGDSDPATVGDVADTTYVVSDQGITFTASEVYCDGYSLYLTAKVESKDGGFNDMMGYGYDDETAAPPTDGTEQAADARILVNTMYAWGDGATDSGITGDTGQNLEGDIIDDNTFVGMMKIDLAQMVSDKGTFNLKLSTLGFDSSNPPPKEDDGSIDMSYRYDGNWDLAIPYTVDTQNVKIIEVNQPVEGGLDINKVFVSPYQVLVYMNAPYTQPNEDNATSKEEYEELWGDKNEEMLAVGEGLTAGDGDTMSYEEWLNDKAYDMEWDIAVYNQDGVKLNWHDISLAGDSWATRCTVKGVEVSKLQIFIGDEWLKFKMANIDEAKERAMFSTVIDVK